MGDYFAHWLKMGRSTAPDTLPKIYYVNWFRHDSHGNFLWPGYAENCRVLKWIFERVNGEGRAIETPIGNVPAPWALDLSGLDISQEIIDQLLAVDVDAWMAEVHHITTHFEMFEDRLPKALQVELSNLEERLSKTR
jgi:phosphoenolpyruvate carboxykinase (GTP)